MILKSHSKNGTFHHRLSNSAVIKAGQEITYSYTFSVRSNATAIDPEETEDEDSVDSGPVTALPNNTPPQHVDLLTKLEGTMGSFRAVQSKIWFKPRIQDREELIQALKTASLEETGSILKRVGRITVKRKFSPAETPSNTSDQGLCLIHSCAFVGANSHILRNTNMRNTEQWRTALIKYIEEQVGAYEQNVYDEYTEMEENQIHTSILNLRYQLQTLRKGEVFIKKDKWLCKEATLYLQREVVKGLWHSGVDGYSLLEHVGSNGSTKFSWEEITQLISNTTKHIIYRPEHFSVVQISNSFAVEVEGSWKAMVMAVREAIDKSSY
jgi:hypothetical protein